MSEGSALSVVLLLAHPHFWCSEFGTPRSDVCIKLPFDARANPWTRCCNEFEKMGELPFWFLIGGACRPPGNLRKRLPCRGRVIVFA